MWGFAELERPFDVFDELRRRMERAFDEAGVRFGAEVEGAQPRANLFDTGAELLLQLEVPGLSEKELDLTITQQALVVRGERKAAAPEGYAVHRRERGDFRFARSFNLPVKIDAERASAKLERGVLTITLPKAAESRPRQITVKAS